MRTIALLLMLLAPLPAAAPTSRPATSAPATQAVRLEDMEQLADGTLRYIPPPQWKLAQKSDLRAVYESKDLHGMIAITVTPQNSLLQDSARDRMAMIIAKGIRAGAEKNSQQLVLPPRVEKDERFFLKMHDAMSGGGMIADRVQMYRLIGLNLVHVVASVQVNDMEESQDVFELAERTLDTMRLTRGAKRVVYPKAQLRAVVPVDWKETKKDDPNGLVATYTDPKNARKQIMLSARIIPKAAREDEQKRKALLEKMIDQERVLPSRLALQKGEEKDVGGTTYLRQIRVDFNGGGTEPPSRMETRYLVVGDVLVSVRSWAQESDADAIGVIADKFAAALKPIREER